MASDGIDELTARVERLERDVGVLRGILWRSTPAHSPAPAYPQAAYLAPWAQAARHPAPVQPAPAPVTLAPADEVRLAGTWFARAGALAVLVGAAFAFKYGIDRGFITEPVRVVIGLLAGLAFVAWGWWARRKGWGRFAHAVTAGGVAICYLSVLVADLAYHLISGPMTLAGLVAITVGNAALAYAYESLALAVLTTAFGFLNPLLAQATGRPQARALYAYTAVFDLGVLGLAAAKGWRPLEALARVGTWALFALGLSAASFRLAEGAATGFFLLFVLAAFVRSTTDEGDVVMLAGSTVSYIGFSMLVLTHFHHEAWRGLFTFGLGGGLAVLGGAAGLVGAEDVHFQGFAASRPKRPAEGCYPPNPLLLRRGLWGLSVAATTLAIPLQFHGFAVAIGWALEGVALSAIGTWAHSLPARLAGGAVAVGGALVTLGLLFGQYAPSHVVVSVQSAKVLAVVAALGVEAWLFSRDEDADARRAAYPSAALSAVGLAIAWMSAEAVAHFHATTGGPGWQTLQFTLSTIWGLSAAVLLAAGVAGRQRWARLGALALFAVTVVKMVTVDLWTLSTGERVLAFLGLGGLLLGCSLLYHRFKDVIFAQYGP